MCTLRSTNGWLRISENLSAAHSNTSDMLPITNALRNDAIGLSGEADGRWSIIFGDILLVKLGKREYIIRE